MRASFARQGRSPNQFGFSQAKALLELGFPYAAVAHLIVSDSSPEESWKTYSIARVLDENMELGEISETKADWLPEALIDRCYQRLLSRCPEPEIGLLSTYLAADELTEPSGSLWIPEGRAASRNPNIKIEVLGAIGRYLKANVSTFYEVPRFPWRRDELE